MKVHRLRVKFVFTGTVDIKAESLEKAIEIAKSDFGLTLGTYPHTSNDNAVIDWDIDIHPEKEVEK